MVSSVSRHADWRATTLAQSGGTLTVWWGLCLAFSVVASFALLSWDAAAGTWSRGAAVSVAGITAIGLLGFVAHLGIAGGRGMLSLGWPGLLFPVLFGLFHFGSLGVVHRGWYDENLFALAWKLSMVCLLCWLAGYGLGRGRALVHANPRVIMRARALQPAELRLVAWLGVGLFVAGLALQLTHISGYGLVEFFLLDYRATKAVLAPSSGNPTAYAYAIGQLVALVGIIVTAVASGLGRRSVLVPRVFAAVFAVYVVALLIQGDRSEAAAALFPVLLIQHTWVRPFPLRSVLVVTTLLGIAFVAAGVFRQAKRVDDVVERAHVDTLARASDEVGYTLDTVIRSQVLVPRSFDYFHGSTYFDAVARALPNTRFRERTWGFVSSTWLARETENRYQGVHGGLAYSIVAEAYINFGVVGAPLLLFFIGLVHGATERWITGKEVRLWLVMLFVVLELALLNHVRNSTVLYLRSAIWMSALLLAVYVVSAVALASRSRFASRGDQ